MRLQKMYWLVKGNYPKTLVSNPVFLVKKIMSNKPHNILYIQGVTRMGGSIESLLGLLKGLDKKIFYPVVVTSKKGRFFEESRSLGVETEVIKMGMWRKGKSLLRIPVSVYSIQSVIKRKNISLVHANTLWDNPYGVIPARLRKVPSICHIRNTFTEDKIKKYYLSKADRIICVSDEIRSGFNGWKLKDEKTATIYNGVDTKRFNDKVKGGIIRRNFNIEDREILIGVVGRVDRTKGQDLLIEAFASLNKRHENLRLMIVGESSLRDRQYFYKLKDFSNSLNLRNKVIFTGYRKDIPEITAAFDIAVFPSLPSSNEGFGRSIIEAMAMKKPVVASAAGGIPEVVVDSITGEIVPPNDSEKLADAIEKLVIDEKRRVSMGEKGYERVIEKFTMERNVKEIEKLYLSLLEDKHN